MPRYDFDSPRLFVDSALQAGAAIALDKAQANYLRNVLRLRAADALLVFNGRDGEWRAEFAIQRHAAELVITAPVRPQTPAADLLYLFAPLKHARLDYMAQKAVEMGASRLQAVITRHTQAARVNLDRLRANAIEAAEQCGILTLPEIAPPLPLATWLSERDTARLLVVCDEHADVADPLEALVALRRENDGPRPLAVLVGPEGGFADDERTALLHTQNVLRLALGPRILRADTAAVAALALVQAVLGDWR